MNMIVVDVGALGTNCVPSLASLTSSFARERERYLARDRQIRRLEGDGYKKHGVIYEMHIWVEHFGIKKN